jgi:hypothetical protein
MQAQIFAQVNSELDRFFGLLPAAVFTAGKSSFKQ